MCRLSETHVSEISSDIGRYCGQHMMKFTFVIVLLAFYRSCTLVGISGVKEKDLEVWQYDEQHENNKKENNS